MSDKLVIGYFYNKFLNLYGDNGNIEVLVSRAEARNIKTEVREVNIESKITTDLVSVINFLFMGGGPVSAQKDVYEDLVKNKSVYVNDFIQNGGVGLYVCGSYQLLGKYYKASDGTVLDGIGAFNLYTEHFGSKKTRCIGNTVARLSSKILNDPVFIHVNKVGRDITGFENHGGRTYLNDVSESFSKVLMGNGNNSEDFTEGCLYKNSIGTYFHGPILARNPHLADYLIAKSLSLDDLVPLKDDIVFAAYTASKKLKQ
jgi:hypothetical protein